MTGTHDTIPTSVRLARWYLAAVAALLLGVTAVTIASHVALAAGGTTLVFSQDEMQRAEAPIGPAPEEGDGRGAAPEPIPADEATGSVQYVDVIGIALTFLGGGVVAAGALMLARRSRWSVPLGLAAVGVTALVGLVPASVGIWAADYYRVDLAQVLPFLLVSALLVALSLAAAVAIWRHRVVVGAAA
jgi:hypothetical protein